MRRNGNPWGLRLTRTTFAIGAIALFLLSGLLAAGLPIAAAQHGPSTPVAAASLAAPSEPTIGSVPSLSGALRAVVTHELTDPNAFVSYGARVTLADEPQIAQETPAQFLGRATNPTLGALFGLEAQGIQTATASQDSHLRPFNFGPLGGYLEAAGIGCATTGGAFFVGAAAATSVSTAGLVLKDNPYTFVLTCAVGVAAGLYIYQNGINSANAALCGACLYAAFIDQETVAYNNYLNLTAGMYASLVSALNWAQVGFDRAADNAALLQIGNITFNATLDLTQAGVFPYLGNLPTTMALQYGADFQNWPEWEGALAGSGAYYGGFPADSFSASLATSNTFEARGVNTAVYGAQNLEANGPVSATSGTYSGLEISKGSTFYYGGVKGETALLFNLASSNAFVRIGPGASLYFNQSAGNLSQNSWGDWLVNLDVSPGWFTYTTSAASSIGIVPTAVQPFSLSSPTIGAPAWADLYWTTSGSERQTGHSGSACAYTAAPGALEVFSSLGSSAPGAGSVNVQVSSWTPSVDPNQVCDALGGAVALNPDENFEDSVATGISNGQDGLTIVPWTAVPILVGQLLVNASGSGQTYWAFIRSLGYSTLGSIPANCIIPAPWQALPAQLNLGNLTANQTQAFYYSFLTGLGNFYGANPAFSVCHGAVQTPYNWTGLSFANLWVVATGGIYLNNGTAPVNVSGASLASEKYGNTSTWAVPLKAGTPASSGGSTPSVTVVNGSVGATTAAAVTNTTNVHVGDTLVAIATSYASGSSPPTYTIADTASNTWKHLSYSGLNSVGSTEVWTVNSTTAASAVDAVTVTPTGGDGTTVQFLVVHGGGGVTVNSAPSPYTSYSTPTQIALSWTNPTNGLTIALAAGYAVQNGTGPAGFASNATSGKGDQARVWILALSAGAKTAKIGLGASSFYAAAQIVTVTPIGATPATNGTNTTLILAPTLRSVAIPVGQSWPVPAVDPIVAFAYLNRTGLVELLLSGNGTRTLGPSAFGSSTPGDAIYLNSCAINGTSVTNCSVSLAPLAVYNATIGGCETTNTCNTGGGGGGGFTSSCGAAAGILAGAINDVAGGWQTAWAGVPILGGAIGGLGCALGWVVVFLLILVVAIVAVWLVVVAVRAVANRRGSD